MTCWESIDRVLSHEFLVSFARFLTVSVRMGRFWLVLVGLGQFWQVSVCLYRIVSKGLSQHFLTIENHGLVTVSIETDIFSRLKPPMPR
jgi:hypothetical protein